MIIYFDKIHDTFFEYCFFNAISHANKEIKKIVGKEYDVKFIVNDIELPLDKTFKDIEGQMDRMIAEKALELYKEKLSDLDKDLYDLIKFVKALEKKAAEKLGLEYKEDE